MAHSLITLGLLLLGASAVSAAPAAASTAASELATSPDLARRATCTFNDCSSAITSKKSCSTIVLSNIEVPAGTTLDLTDLNPGTNVIFEGKITFGYKEWLGPLISVSGVGIVVTGTPDSLIDGGGERWWDGYGGNGGKTKPRLFSAHSLTGASSIDGLNVQNTPVHAFSISGSSDLTLSNIVLDNSAGYASGIACNTDAFGVSSSTNIVISGVNVKNQDDCLAINSGTNITFTGGRCYGGHGLSIGSVGGRSNNKVQSVTIENSTVSNSMNGVRIKTIAGKTGSVSDITFRDITLSDITDYAIVVEQDYENGGPTGKPTAGVPITDLTITNVHGNISSTATKIYVLCASGACSDWSWSDISITGGIQSHCKNAPASVGC